jgi:multidrug resistance efflux pump
VQLEVAVEVIGERSLRIEELEADMEDMRVIFKAQLEEAVAQLTAARAQLDAQQQQQQQQQQRSGGKAQAQEELPDTESEDH